MGDVACVAGVFFVDVVSMNFPVNCSMQPPVKDVDSMRRGSLGAVTLRNYRLRGHAVISGLVKVAQKLENEVQTVVEWVSSRLPSRTSRRRNEAGFVLLQRSTAVSCQPTETFEFEIDIFVSAGIVNIITEDHKPLSFTFCKCTGATDEWFRTPRGARPLER